mgnify:FL=1
MKKIILLFLILVCSYTANAQFDIKGSWVGQLDGTYLKLQLKHQGEVYMVYDEDNLYSTKNDTLDIELNYEFNLKKDTSDFKLRLLENDVLVKVESFQAKVLIENTNRMKWFLLFESDNKEDVYELILERLKVK